MAAKSRQTYRIKASAKNARAKATEKDQGEKKEAPFIGLRGSSQYLPPRGGEADAEQEKEIVALNNSVENNSAGDTRANTLM